MTIHEIIAHFGTMTKMSNKTGIPYRTIQDWKRGERSPPAWVVRLLVKAYMP